MGREYPEPEPWRDSVGQYWREADGAGEALELPVAEPRGLLQDAQGPRSATFFSPYSQANAATFHLPPCLQYTCYFVTDSDSFAQARVLHSLSGNDGTWVTQVRG